MKLRTAALLFSCLATAAAQPPGYKLEWIDNFNGVELDQSKWMYRIDVKAESSQRPENVSVENGNLVIQMKEEQHRGKNFTGGGIISKRRFRYGYYEARVKMFGGSGWHQSVWAMLASDGTTTYPEAMRTEIDGMEFDSATPAKGHMGTIIWEGPGKSHSLTCTPGKYQADLGFDATTGFHTYGFEWTEKGVSYYLDGERRCNIDYPTHPADHDEVNFWLTALGYEKGGKLDPSKLPGRMLVDFAAFYTKKPSQDIVLKAGDTQLTIARETLAIGLDIHGATAAGMHPQGGLLLGDPDHPEVATLAGESYDAAGHLVLNVRTASGKSARVIVTLTPNQADFVVVPSEPQAVLMRLGPAQPGFGLADHAVTGRQTFDTDITGYHNDRFLSGTGLTRMVSNFVIYPKQKFAFLIWDPGVKIVRSTAEECTQGARRVEREVRFTIFAGTPHEIYRQYLESRNQYGYPVLKPKYEYFGVGWEAFGALAWDTNQQTVKENIDHYLAAGYPLEWMVVGSGFWPKAEDRLHETTSFGLYDKTLYPDPRAFIAYFHSKGLKYFQGLRTTFITDGPFSAEGLKNGYFVEEDGKPKIFTFGWPKSPIYFLDWTKPQAVTWFDGLVHRWTDFGVDGFKEDVYGFGKYTLGDDKLDSVNYALMREGLYMMGRNAYLASVADLHRINDFNYNQDQDRGPVNALALAYSGFPLVYPDIVGGTFGERHFDLKVTPKMRTYMMRNAQWASLHSSMSMGQGPWTFGDPKLEQVMLDAARLHDRLQPYIYSQAVRFFLDGYPWTMAPLPVAFPDDPQVYGRENQKVRGYEWMIGDSLLAAPLYGNDYETANTRDVYLPAGEWLDYDTGKQYQGPQLLHNFALPAGKTPLFVGGAGIVTEKKGAQVVARIFPINPNAESSLIDRDGVTRTTIRLHVSDWKKVSVSTASGHAVRGAWQKNAFEFVTVPGETYELR